MANRHTLAVTKLNDFKEWLIKDGWEIQDTKGYWEVLRAVKQGKKRPILVYRRIDSNNGTPLVHYSIDERDLGIINQFIYKGNKND